MVLNQKSIRIFLLFWK